MQDVPNRMAQHSDMKHAAEQNVMETMEAKNRQVMNLFQEYQNPSQGALPNQVREIKSEIQLCVPTPQVPIGMIVYLNLKRSPERREHMEKLLNDYFPDVPHVRLQGIEDATKDLGILKSHLTALRWGNLHQLPVLVLEDDFEFYKPPEEVRAVLGRLDQTLPGWDVFSFSPFLFECARIVKDGQRTEFLKIYRMTTASAYLVSTPYVQTLVDHYRDTLHRISRSGFRLSDSCDQTWHTLQRTDKWVCCTEMLGGQRPGKTTQMDYADNRFYFSEDMKEGMTGEGDKRWPVMFEKEFTWPQGSSPDVQ